eukprot:139457_1
MEICRCADCSEFNRGGSESVEEQEPETERVRKRLAFLKEKGIHGLCIAVRDGDLHAVHHLLTPNDFDDLNARDNYGGTALNLAASRGLTEVVRLLLRQPGINANKRDGTGFTSLHRAAMYGHHDVVARLLAHPGIDVNATDTTGKTALCHAAFRGHKEAVAAMMSHPGIDVNLKDLKGSTALLSTVKWNPNNCDDVVSSLLKHPGVDANIMDKTGQTVLHHAIVALNNRIIKRLLALPDIDVNVMQRDSAKGRTPLQMAAILNYKGIVKSLLDHPRIDVNTAGKSGFTALHHAALRGRIDIVRMLLGKSGVRINAKDNIGRTAVQLAANRRHYATVVCLLSCPGSDISGIDLSATDESGKTLLHHVTSHGEIRLVDLILGQPDMELFVNLTDANGNTALILASNGSPEIVHRFLRNPRVELHKTNIEGQTAATVTSNAAIQLAIQEEIENRRTRAFAILDGHIGMPVDILNMLLAYV